MGTLSQQQVEAARQYVGATVETLTSERGVHAETAVAGTARMAGTFLFRSFDFSLPGAEPGQPVLSDQANEQGPRLIQILGSILEQAGIRLDGELLGNVPGPEHQPQLSFLETQRQLEPKYSDINARLGLSLPDASDSAAVATALLIQQCAQVLDPHIAFGIAAYGFIEGTKTVPESMT